MEKIRTIIIEDHEHSSFLLAKRITENCPQLEIVGFAENVKDALSLIEKTKPNLVFLDIELGNETGFELIDQIPNPEFQIVFVTAHNRYAVQAFQYNALHYLLKPIDPEELVEAVDRINFADSSKKQYHSAFEDYIQNKWDRIASASVSKVTYVQLEDLIRIQSDGSYSIFLLKNNEKIISTKPIKFYDDLLSEKGFYRAHRSHLVNLSKITEYQKGTNDKLILTDNSIIDIPRSKRTDILAALDNS